MKLDCLMTGVGGQGTVLASKLLAQTALNLGYPARTSETIGMAQRGGCVVSHIRIGEGLSPSIPLGQADLLIGFEPAEAVRNFAYLKRDGEIIVCSKPVMPVGSALGCAAYDSHAMLEFLKKHAYRLTIIDGEKLCHLAGNIKTLNVILLGAALGQGLLPFSQEDLEHTIKTSLNPKLWQMNIQALGLGMRHQRL